MQRSLGGWGIWCRAYGVPYGVWPLKQVANAAVLRLTKEAQWMAEAVAGQDSLRSSPDTFIDRCAPPPSARCRPLLFSQDDPQASGG